MPDDQAFVRRVQMMLNMRGFPVGIDGKAGDELRSAIRAFQAKAGLQPTGLATPATMAALVQRQAADQPQPVSETAAGPMDFAGPQPPARPDLQGALDQKAGGEAVRQMLQRSLMDGLIGLRLPGQQAPAAPPAAPAPPPMPREAPSQPFPWSI